MKTTNVVQAAQTDEGVNESAQEMTIDETSSVFLMDALGKLYSQPARAALREYLSNAIDAHIEAGGKHSPIKIHLPSQSDRTLSIRDFGTGMSEDNFNNILSRYGASTKRNSNKVHGGFGLGAKAGFAVADEFFMTSYQNGKRIKVRIFKNESGKGFIDVVERSTTTEPDGLLVEVTVPLSNHKELSFESLTKDKFFSAYKGSEIEVISYQASTTWSVGGSQKKIPVEELSFHNPEHYDKLEYGGTVIGWLSKHRTNVQHEHVRAVIGRVVYTITPDSSYNSYSRVEYSNKFGTAFSQISKFRREFILNLPIGSVDLPSSREEITYSSRSISTISALAESAHRTIGEVVMRNVNAKTSGFEALCETLALIDDGFWNAQMLTWRGKDLPLTKLSNSASFSQSANIIRYEKNRQSRNSLHVETVTHGRPDFVRRWASDKYDTLMITPSTTANFPDVAGKVRRNMNDYYSAKGVDKVLQVFLFAPNDPMTEWFEQGKKITLEDFLAVGKKFRADKRAAAKATAAARAANNNLNQTTVVNASARQVAWVRTNEGTINSSTYVKIEDESEVLVDGKDFYYLSKTEAKEFSITLTYLYPTISSSSSSSRLDSEAQATLRALNKILGENAKLVFLPANRNMDKFKEAYPEIPSVIDAIKENLKAEWDDVELNGKKDSYLSALFWLVDYQKRTKAVLLHKFVTALKPGEITSLNTDLQDINLYLSSRSAESKQLHSIAREIMSSDYTDGILKWIGDLIEKADKRYPLLTNLNPVNIDWTSTELKTAMIGYLKTC